MTRTPYRISFFGGGSDYPQYYREYGGAVLGATIDKYCWISVKARTPFGPKFKVVYSRVEECDELEEVEHPAVRECLRYCGYEDKGCEVYHTSDLPARSGMGSSSAFVVGLLNALFRLRGDEVVPRQVIARIACNTEQRVLNETVGSQDQYLTALGGLRKVEFREYGEVVPWAEVLSHSSKDVTTGAVFQKYLMLFFTGVTRTASDVASGYVKDMWADGPTMGRLVGMVEEGISALVCRHFHTFGMLLDEAWLLKKRWYGVTNPIINGLYEKAKASGALGGKILGAGGGGFLLLFVPPEKQSYVREALTGLIEVPVRFESEGSKVVLS